ncbi:MAG: hypothetical protein IKR33_05235 [Bacteroidales bacterium]|nr:hypothetical protein [Bacteroidales bacterium]
MAHTGVVDYGSSSINSRHTVNTNPNQYDSRTNNQLRVIPQGYTKSVRLGNWDIHWQAESLVYDYHVDTSAYDLLILKYAVVLENPDHSSYAQPKFQFQIKDSNGMDINYPCNSALFVANSALGWNQVPVYYDWGSWQNFDHYILWKDWTTIGVDLSPLHGQNISIQLTTYDCNEGDHYGYAYFVLDCANKKIASTNCGVGVSNQFTAPDGFVYRWYEVDSPNIILSNDRTYNVQQPGEYHCRCSFIGSPSGNCYFDLINVAGNRYPTANFITEIVDSIGCDSVKFRFTNTSFISRDVNHTDNTLAPCESIKWIIDGNPTTYKSPTVTFGRGSHRVSLIASLSNGTCTDTLSRTFVVTNLCVLYDTICIGETYRLFDTLINTAGYYERDSAGVQRAVELFVQYNDTTFVYDTIVENELPYVYQDVLYEGPTTNLPLHYVDSNGCDSVVFFSLYVHQNIVNQVDSIVCEGELPLIWNDSVFTTAGSKIIRHLNVGANGEDSIIVMTLNVLSDSVAIIYDTLGVNFLPVVRYGDTINAEQSDAILYSQTSEGCLLTIHYNLHVVYNTFEHFDSTVCENQLPVVWHDSIFTTECSKTIIYTSIYGADSVLELSLHVNPSYYSRIYDTLVENQTYSWGNSMVSAPGNYFDTMQTVNGCDSIRHLTTILLKHLDSTVCDNQLPVSWYDSLFFAEDTLHIEYRTLNEVDSIIEISLHTKQSYIKYDTLQFCQKDTGYYNYYTSGDYQVMYNATNQCDSLVYINVIIHQEYHENIIDSFCEGQSYLWRGRNLSSSGILYDTILTDYGCDSVLELRLTMLSSDYTIDSVMYCIGTTFIWENGMEYSEATEGPEIIYLNSDGCDSIVRLSLSFPYETFHAYPHVSPQIVTQENLDVCLCDNSNSIKREWRFLGFVDSSKTCSFQYPLDEDSVEVLLIVGNEFGCMDSACVIVRLDKSAVWAPNVFTPNQLTNNSFYFVLNEIIYAEAWIYDRKGLFITHFDATKDGWDGTRKGVLCEQSSYVWKLRYSTKMKPQQVHERVGTVLLLR